MSIDETPLWSKSTEQCRISGDWHTDSIAIMKKGEVAIVLESSYSSECEWWEHQVLFGEVTGWVVQGYVKSIRKCKFDSDI